jgi:hypothetical protein
METVLSIPAWILTVASALPHLSDVFAHASIWPGRVFIVTFLSAQIRIFATVEVLPSAHASTLPMMSMSPAACKQTEVRAVSGSGV